MRPLLLIVCLTACSPVAPTVDGGSGGGSAAGGSAVQVVDAGDPTAPLFDPDHLVEVSIDVAPADWEVLRNQTRDLFTLLSGNCTSQPFPSPFTTFESTVTVDGTRLPRSTVKKKGFLGSLSVNRPSLKLKFDANVPKQKVSGLDAMTLNNAQQDPSIVRQCLGYALFRKAGLRAPRCNFAHVVVNGADLGVYAHVEAIDNDFLERHFTKKSGSLYEGTLSDFTTTFVGTFDLKNTGDRSDLERVTAALRATDAELEVKLAAVIDLNQFIDFWAMETLLRHWDGYAGNTNNFFIYDDPETGRFTFIPWGADAVFGAEPSSADNPEGPMLRGVLARRLYNVPALRQRYLARVRSLLSSVFFESELRREVVRMENLVRPHVHPIQAAQLSNGLADVRRFIDTRRTNLTRELTAAPALAPSGERASPCLYPLGRFDSTFSTNWGTITSENPFGVSSATFDLTLDGGTLPFARTASTAGIDTGGNDGPKAGVNLIAARADGTAMLVGLRMLPQLYPPAPDAGVIPLDLVQRVGIVVEFVGGVVKPIGLLGPGTVEFTSASDVDGGVVSGHVSGQVVSWPFGAGM
ncbi:MAG: CotH kinase family protein [Archangium sp.]|nr:CotH kinase family protein [Archangium sp.]